jgi:hypothetical protein
MIRPVIHSAATLGVPVELMVPIGILELILLALYLIPSTGNALLVFGGGRVSLVRSWRRRAWEAPVSSNSIDPANSAI